MTDYPKMYQELFRAVTKAIDLLQRAQIKTEEIYISASETVIELVPQNENEDGTPD